MIVLHRTPTADIRCGDALEQLRLLPDASVQTVITSPPFFGLRDYGVDGQIGLEETLGLYLERIVFVFREIRRVLRADGTLWVEIGDKSVCNPKGHDGTRSTLTKQAIDAKRLANNGAFRNQPQSHLGRKNLMGIPWRVAFALQDDGWILRMDNIWEKPNAMPDSARDRPSRSHTYLFLFSKCPRYYYNRDAASEPCSPNTHLRVSQNVADQIGSLRAHAGSKSNGTMKAVVRGPGVNPKAMPKCAGWQRGEGSHDTIAHAKREKFVKQNSSFAAATLGETLVRNKRSVWRVPTQPYRGNHYATFPEKLVEPCILAGSRPGDLVLDPFCGTGTVGKVANELGRDFIGIELNPKTCVDARRRIATAQPPLIVSSTPHPPPTREGKAPSWQRPRR